MSYRRPIWIGNTRHTVRIEDTPNGREIVTRSQVPGEGNLPLAAYRAIPQGWRRDPTRETTARPNEYHLPIRRTTR